MDDRSEVNLFFSGGFRLVPDDDVQIGVAGAVIVLVGLDLLLKALDRGTDAARAGLAALC